MARELLLSMLSLLLVGTLHVVCGAGVGRFWALPPLSRVTSARAAELQAWRLLWAPLVPGALVLAFLLGWALQEPEQAEALHAWAYLCAAPILLVWGRAVHRAWRAGLARHVPVAGTVGLLRPRVVVAEALRAALDADALAAAMAHEAAHVRHRDPLRLWLGQLATDLQWPAPGAARRLARWRSALELARDEEACKRGVAGPDLAAALIAAARLHSRSRGAVAGLGDGAAEVLRLRVARLLVWPAAGGAAGAAAVAASDVAAAVAASGAAAGLASELATGANRAADGEAPMAGDLVPARREAAAPRRWAPRLPGFGALVLTASALVVWAGYRYGELVVSRIADL
ncbi:MAG: M48 family metalloprotease [Myxococcales bacterium]|nr:M48 family metalloprotease [Myxococcales bacterium]